MSKILVVVESPAKCKKIASFLAGFLGNSYTLTSCFGHFRDLTKGLKAINITNNFTPTYEVKNNKIASQLRSLYKKHDKLVIATDLDREGEAIGWHLTQLLKLDPLTTERIVFNQITKTAVQNAMKNIGTLDMNLVNAYQARRIADRLIGFELSPLLWRNIQPKLSAGRCQSPAQALVYDREKEIEKFQSSNYFETTGIFSSSELNLALEGSFNTKHENITQAKKLLNDSRTSNFQLDSITKKLSKNKPPPPYTTSSIQQDASNKLGMSPKICMSVAQKLYEAGHITYMRTDSLELSTEALNMCKSYITSKFGNEYYQFRTYKTKTAHSQEAHEAIRPTKVYNSYIEGTSQQQRLYGLIHKRTVASQMKESEKDIFTGKISMDNRGDKVICKSEQLLFLGYLAVYGIELPEKNEKIYNIIDNSSELLPVPIKYSSITSQEKYTKSQGRFTEATLIKELEKRGIGRPATWSNLISIIQDRGYVLKDTRPGKEVIIHTLTTTENSPIKTTKTTATINNERNKLFITDVGKITTEFLRKHFDNIMDYKFTEKVSNQLDLIANNEIIWHQVVGELYTSFHPKVVELLENNTGENREKHRLKRNLGTNKKGEPLIVYLGKYGPLIQIGDHEDHKKNRFVGIPSNMSLESITLEEAQELTNATGVLGEYKEHPVELKNGRYGFYIVYNGQNIAIPDVKTRDMDNFSIEDACAILEISESNIISQFGKTLSIRKGPYGNYIKYGKKNIPLPSEIKEDVEKLKKLTKEELMELAKNPPKRKPRPARKTTKSKGTKTTTKSKGRGKSKSRGRGKGRGRGIGRGK